MEPIWSPTPPRIEKSRMYHFMHSLGFNSYAKLHAATIKDAGPFWARLFLEFEVIFEGDLDPNVTDLSFKSYGWFPNVKLNFAENLLKHNSAEIALNFVHESGKRKRLTYRDLKREVSKVASLLKDYITEGDVVAAYMPNIPETVVAMLATSSLGGIFTSTSCDFGVSGVVDRFGESNPKVLFAAKSYEYGGKEFDQTEKIKEIVKSIPSIKKVIVVDFLNGGEDDYKEIMKLPEKPLTFKRLPFNHPIYIMYSSGTTGKPKCIVHTQGGTLLQHIKELGLHTDLNEHKNIFFFTTCGWMMWNWLVSSLFFGSKVTLYEGSPSYPTLKDFTHLINVEEINIFGTSPKFLKALEDSGFSEGDFPTLTTLLSTGAPLLPEQFDFIYKKIKSDVLVGSISGGTDIIGCFMLANPILPVFRGEIQSIGLGMDVSEQDGELVCKSSFPSRPLGFLHDPDGKKFKEAYFYKDDNIWAHGDFIKITENGGVIVYGRSDATLNPGGVRIGTAEIYRETERIPEIVDSICVGKDVNGDVEVILFVKLKGYLTPELTSKIKEEIRKRNTPRHVPSKIIAVKDIPYTRSGKKMELLINRIINNKKITNIEAVANPDSLDEYKEIKWQN